jgi:hypothetical protein
LHETPFAAWAHAHLPPPSRNRRRRHAYTYEADGGLLIEDGRIALPPAPYDSLRALAHPDATVIDHRAS